MPSHTYTLTIIIPAYNEEQRIGAMLQKYAEYYEQRYVGRYTLLVVLNGCHDGTERVVQEYQQRYSAVQYLNFSEAIGKGGAIIEGLKAATGDLVAYTDADGSTRPEILDRLCTTLALNPMLDCVIGSRWMKGAVATRRKWKRRLMSAFGHFFVQLYFRLGIKDTQCGAKVLRRSMIPKILPHLSISNMAFDVNFLVDIKRAGGRILEMPIEWEDHPDSTITHPIRTSILTFLSITRLWLLYSPFRFLYPVLRPLSDFIHRLLVKRS
ncbi:MAG: glycosyltransferase family 2 protein [Candidatus Kerfeldbacteria bacterium]|nr:glycosyltransferase family 2 protein [Candidatus Kerfeldbacteria bacterium]